LKKFPHLKASSPLKRAFQERGGRGNSDFTARERKGGRLIPVKIPDINLLPSSKTICNMEGSELFGGGGRQSYPSSREERFLKLSTREGNFLGK